MPSPESILKLAQDIVDAKNNLASLEQEWAKHFPNPVTTAPPVRAARKGGKKPDPNSAQSRILAILSGSPSKQYTATEVSQLLGINQKQAERGLFKLYAAKKIMRPARGMFQGKGAT